MFSEDEYEAFEVIGDVLELASDLTEGDDATNWDVLAKALADLSSATQTVSGDGTNVHFYAPLSSAHFSSLVDDFHDAGFDCTETQGEDGENAFCVRQRNYETRIKLMNDPDMLRAVLVESDNPRDDWLMVDSIIGTQGAHVVGDTTTPAPTATPEEHIKTLEGAATQIQSGIASASKLSGTAKGVALGAGQRAIDAAKTLGQQIVQFPVDVVTETEKTRVGVVMKSLDASQAALNAAKETAGGAIDKAEGWGKKFLAGLAAGQVAEWVLAGLVGFAVYKYYLAPKAAPKAA